MPRALSFAESGDPNASNLPIILGGLLLLAAVAFFAFVLIFISRARKHRHSELITTATIFWAIISAASLLYAGESQIDWSKQHELQLESGYLDPRDTTDTPKLPWPLWSGLGVAYGAMLIWSLSKSTRIIPSPGLRRAQSSRTPGEGQGEGPSSQS